MTTQAPSLLKKAAPAAPLHAPLESHSLADALYDGFYMLFLVKNRNPPSDAETFRNQVKEFLVEFKRSAKRLNADPEDYAAAKYAFCALVDETVLTSRLRIRDAWERMPLQLELFGEQLAGENYFARLEKLRQQGAARLQALEVFHLCLLLGFQGKYLLEGTEKLNYLTARLGDEIAHLKGKRAGFAPHGLPPDRIVHALKNEVPLWAIGSLFAFLGLLAYLGLDAMLDRSTETNLARHANVVSAMPRAAHLTITLP
jgi:type VI secretion system protein ImpK